MINPGQKVSHRDYPGDVGTVVALKPAHGKAVVSLETGVRVETDLVDLVEVHDTPLPDKSWPPSGMETKAR